MPMSGNDMRAYFRERFECIRTVNKFRFREFLIKYQLKKGQELPHLDDIERILHITRSREMSLTARERDDSKKWLSLNTPEDFQ